MIAIPSLSKEDRPYIEVSILEDNHNEQIGMETELRDESDINLVCITDDPGKFLNLIEDGKVDVAIIDLKIYDDDNLGLNVLRKIKKSSSRTKCLILTNHDKLSNLMACMDAGAEGFARKVYRPHQQPDLAELIRILASGNYYYPPDLSFEMHEYIDRKQLQLEDVRSLGTRNPLTNREREALTLAGGQGLSDEEISAKMGIEKSTVKQHLTSGYNKIGVHERVRAYQTALINGWLNASPMDDV